MVPTADVFQFVIKYCYKTADVFQYFYKILYSGVVPTAAPGLCGDEIVRDRLRKDKRESRLERDGGVTDRRHKDGPKINLRFRDRPQPTLGSLGHVSHKTRLMHRRNRYGTGPERDCAVARSVQFSDGILQSGDLPARKLPRDSWKASGQSGL